MSWSCCWQEQGVITCSLETIFPDVVGKILLVLKEMLKLIFAQLKLLFVPLEKKRVYSEA